MRHVEMEDDPKKDTTNFRPEHDQGGSLKTHVPQGSPTDPILRPLMNDSLTLELKDLSVMQSMMYGGIVTKVLGRAGTIIRLSLS